MEGSDKAVRLLCLPYAGGSETTYLSWRHHLPSWIDVIPVPLPGRGSRIAELPLDECEQLVRQLRVELRSQMQGPYALFGHSMGALLAYELAHQMREESDAPPMALFVSGSVAPPHRIAHPEWLGDDNSLLQMLEQMNGTPPELLADPEWRALLLPALRADFRLCARYRHRLRPPMDCPVYALAGRNDPATRDARKVAAWCMESRLGGELRCFPGDHFFIKNHQRDVLNYLSKKLRNVHLSSLGTSALAL